MTTPLPSALDLQQGFRRRARRSLGQNFLIDERALASIADACATSPDASTLEIGPGPGGLTQALLRRGQPVLAIEKDRDAVPFLREQFAGHPLEVIEGDALKHRLPDDDSQWVVTGNLPYNISTQVFFRTLEWRGRLARCVFMFQREVAQRFVAVPRTKAYGILALVSQLFYTPELLLTVPPGAFRPIPKVHSAVVRFTPRPLPLPEHLTGDFRQVIKASFAQRRKKLSNNLKGFRQFDRDAILEILDGLGLGPNARAEELDLDTFCALTLALRARADAR